jgi:hypothetical protein
VENRGQPAPIRRLVHPKIPDIPYLVGEWRREHPGEDIPDGHVFTQRWPAGPASKRRGKVICCQYKADRARRTLRGISEQVAKAEKAVAGLAPFPATSARPSRPSPSPVHANLGQPAMKGKEPSDR